MTDKINKIQFLNKLVRGITMIYLGFLSVGYAVELNVKYIIQSNDIVNLKVQEARFIKGNNQIQIQIHNPLSWTKDPFANFPEFTILKDATDSPTDAGYAIFYIKIGYDEQNYCEFEQFTIDRNSNNFACFSDTPDCKGNIEFLQEDSGYFFTQNHFLKFINLQH